MSDFVQQQAQICDFTTSDSWVILSEIEQSIKRKIESVGTPLKDWDINIYRGVLTGYNDAFIIPTEKRDEILANCVTPEERERTAELIRPILRGRDIKRYGYEWKELWLINTHNGVKGKLPRVDIKDYPAIKAHLDQYWDKIEKRADQGDTPYNLRNCAYVDDFNKPKIVWARLMRIAKSDMDSFPRFAAVKAGMFVVDSLCFFGGKDIETICTMLNSTYAAYYFLQNIAILDNGGMQMRQQYVEEIPLPKIKMHTESDLYSAFGLTKTEIEHIESFVLQRKIEIANS